MENFIFCAVSKYKAILKIQKVATYARRDIDILKKIQIKLVLMFNWNYFHESFLHTD